MNDPVNPVPETETETETHNSWRQHLTLKNVLILGLASVVGYYMFFKPAAPLTEADEAAPAPTPTPEAAAEAPATALATAAEAPATCPPTMKVSADPEVGGKTIYRFPKITTGEAVEIDGGVTVKMASGGPSCSYKVELPPPGKSAVGTLLVAPSLKKEVAKK